MIVPRTTGAVGANRDDGAVLVLFALSITAIMLIVALVIDLSNVRNTRQDSKSVTDASAAAGLQSLVEDGIPRPWRGACTALAYLKANQPDRSFTVAHYDGAHTPIDTAAVGDPCTTLLDQTCTPNDKSTWAWISATDGEFVADIRTGYETPDPNFPEDAGAYLNDDSDPLRGSCDQLAVIVSKTDPALFGGIAGESNYETATRSVGRVAIQTKGKGVPAFLMLERTSCPVLSQAVGASEGGIIVEAPTLLQPGIIHIDSSGTNGCGGGPSSEGNFTVYSDTLGTSPKRPGIVIEDAGLDQGILSLYSLRIGNTEHAYGTAEGVSTTPTPGDIISRQPVDDKYNSTLGTPTITNIHAATQPLAIRDVAPDGYTTESTCNGQSDDIAGTKVFVDCPAGYTPTDVTFVNATEIIFNGPVHVPNGSQLYMPVARRIVIGGTSDGGLSVAGSGRLGINSVTPFADTRAGVEAACTGREGPAHANTTQLIVFGGRAEGARAGALNVGGRAALCQTFVYLAGPKSESSYVRQATIDGSYHSTCVIETPCPKLSDNVASDSHLDVAGYLKWSAPNQLTSSPPEGAAGIEDLALWTETDSLSNVDGVLDVQGLFFFPNGRVETRSPAEFNPRDAQFIARSLKLLQGTLQMKPTPANSVEVDVLVGVSLVR